MMRMSRRSQLADLQVWVWVRAAQRSHPKTTPCELLTSSGTERLLPIASKGIRIRLSAGIEGRLADCATTAALLTRRDREDAHHGPLNARSFAKRDERSTRKAVQLGDPLSDAGTSAGRAEGQQTCAGGHHCKRRS